MLSNRFRAALIKFLFSKNFIPWNRGIYLRGGLPAGRLLGWTSLREATPPLSDAAIQAHPSGLWFTAGK